MEEFTIKVNITVHEDGMPIHHLLLNGLPFDVEDLTEKQKTIVNNAVANTFKVIAFQTGNVSITGRNTFNKHIRDLQLLNAGVNPFIPSTGDKILSEEKATNYYIYTNTHRGGWSGLGSVTVIAQNAIEAHGVFVTELIGKDLFHHINVFNPNDWVQHNSVHAKEAKYITHIHYEE